MKTQNILLIIGAIGAVGYGVYWLFFSKAPETKVSARCVADVNWAQKQLSPSELIEAVKKPGVSMVCPYTNQTYTINLLVVEHLINRGWKTS